MLALALLAAAPIDRRDAMERCAEAVIATLHPNMGMADVTGTRFEAMTTTATGSDWVVRGVIVEPDGKTRIAHRFTCRTRGQLPPQVSVGKSVRR